MLEEYLGREYAKDESIVKKYKEIVHYMTQNDINSNILFELKDEVEKDKRIPRLIDILYESTRTRPSKELYGKLAAHIIHAAATLDKDEFVQLTDVLQHYFGYPVHIIKIIDSVFNVPPNKREEVINYASKINPEKVSSFELGERLIKQFNKYGIY